MAEGHEGWDDYAPFYDWENARTLGRRDVPFWLRLEYTVDDGAAVRTDDSGFTLRGMIDALSGRKKTGEPRQSLEAWPFRLPH